MDSQTDLRSSKCCQNLGHETMVNFKKKRAMSLDELKVSIHLFPNPACCKPDLRKSVNVSLDDCSLYLTRKREKQCSLTTNGIKSSDTKAGLQNLEENTQCICRLLFKEPHQAKPCYDLVASPGPRFLLRTVDLADSPFSASFKIPASVPFKWEEAPGKPRLDAAIMKPDRSLQLPPRLLTKMSSTNCSSPGRPKSGKLISHSPNRGSGNASMECSTEKPKSCTPLIFRSTELNSSDRKPKYLYSSCEMNSPRSILGGPLLNSTSSSSGPNSVSDSETSTLAAPLTEFWSDLAGQLGDASCIDTENSVSHPDLQLLPYVECNLNDLAPSPEVKPVRSRDRIFQGFKAVVKFLNRSKIRWQKGKPRQKGRAFSEVEYWAPTLATYFHRLDGSKFDTMTENLRLLDNVDAEKMCAFEKRCQELFSGITHDDPASSTPTACTCHCRDSPKKQSDQLSLQSANNVAAALRHSQVYPSEKDKIDNERHHGSNIGRFNSECPPSRFLLLSPSRIGPMKGGSQRMKLQARRSEKTPRSLSLLVKAVKQPFPSRKPDIESLALNPVCCLVASRTE